MASAESSGKVLAKKDGMPAITQRTTGTTGFVLPCLNAEAHRE